ncbi:MAG: sulfite exporter TauE/SafE family protein [Clostridia bacterium]|nr:sulfite exporter TauE/SafE family protein [Clostridia bacterium]
MNDILTATLAGLISGIVGSMGMGGGGVLIIYLTLFAGVEQIKAQGTNLLFFIPIAIVSLIIYWRRDVIDLKKNLQFILWGICGCLPGYFLATKLQNGLLSKIFGAGLILLAAREIYGCSEYYISKRRKEAKRKSRL